MYLIPIILIFFRNVISSSYFRGWIYKWSSAIKLLDETTLEGSSNIGRSYRHLTNYIVSKDQKKALTILYTNDDGGEVSKYLVPQIRELSKTIKEQTNTSYSLFGESVMLYDKWRDSVESLPWVAIVSILIYFIAISVITLAPFLVFRFFVSGLLLFSFTLGFFVVAKHPAISFISFMMGFPFIQGAAFGAEVSAYSVLTHYKKVGFDLKSSVVREMYFRMIQSIAEPIIGVVVFIPFACTSLPLLKDMGMIMICIFVTSLVFVQYLISPSLTMLWKDGNWWPRSYGVIFNQPTKTYDDSEIIKPIMDYVQKGINSDFYEENEN